MGITSTNPVFLNPRGSNEVEGKETVRRVGKSCYTSTWQSTETTRDENTTVEQIPHRIIYEGSEGQMLSLLPLSNQRYSHPSDKQPYDNQPYGGKGKSRNPPNRELKWKR